MLVTTDQCPPAAWPGCRVAPSPGRRRRAQCPRPGILHLQDRSPMEWLQPDWNPNQDSSQAPHPWCPTQSDVPRGRSGSPRPILTHCSRGGATVAGVGRRGTRGLSHSFPKLPWLYCAGPTPTFDLWYIQTRKGGLWAAGAGSTEGVAASWGGVEFVGGGAYFWGFWDWLRSRQADTTAFFRGRRWQNETTTSPVLPHVPWICDLRRRAWSQPGKSEGGTHQNYSVKLIVWFLLMCQTH